MNVSPLSNGLAAYDAGQNSSLGLAQVADHATSAKNIVDPPDLLDLSPEGMQAADEIETKPSSEETSSEIKRDQLTVLWETGTSVASYLQLGFSLVSDDNTFVAKMFDVTINSAEKQLEVRIESLLEEAGIELDEEAGIELDEDERFEIHIDAEGQINVTLLDAEGEENEEKAQAIADVLNADETLGQEMLRVKALKNSRDSILGFEPDKKNYLLGHDSFGTSMMPDIETRKFLVDNYLQRELGLSLDDIELDESRRLTLVGIEDPERGTLLDLSKKIQEEVTIVLENDKPGEDKQGLTADYSFGGGVLLDTEETSDESIQENLSTIYSGDGLVDHPQDGVDSIVEALMAYNSTAAEDQKISDFSIVVDQAGRISIEGQFVSGDDLGSSTKTMIKSWMTPTLKALTEVTTNTILKKHNAEHGDVEEYPHEVEFQVNLIMGITTEIHSEEADTAALADIAKTTVEVASVLGSYVEETFRENHDEMSEGELQTLFSKEVEIQVDEDGLLSLSATTSENQAYLQEIQGAIAMLNECLYTDKETEVQGYSATDRLPKELRPALDLLQQIQQDMTRIHNRSLCSARFTI